MSQDKDRHFSYNRQQFAIKRTLRLSTSLTVEEAVALMINMDFIPAGETVLSMTEAFLEEATVEYENASANDKYQLKAFENRMKACANRHSLALLLKKSLFEDAIYTEDTLIECADNSTDENPLVMIDSLTEWAFDRFGIVIPNKRGSVHENFNPVTNTKLPSWDTVIIKIYADYNLGYSIGNGNFKRIHFSKVDLMGTRKGVPNELGKLLIDLSLNKKYPSNGIVIGKHKTNISKLKKILIQLMSLDGEPFYKPNKADGYKPRFKLIDDRKNAVKRAEESAKHESFDDSKSYYHDVEDIDTPSSAFLDEYDNN